MTGIAASTAAQAQCTDNFDVAGVNIPIVGNTAPVSQLMPLGNGSSLAAFISTINTVNTAFATQTSAFVTAPGQPEANQRGSGAWSRAIAGKTTTESSSVGTVDGSGLAVPVAATGTQNCATKIRTTYAGVQFGYDFSRLNVNGTGANWFYGLTGGWIKANTKDLTKGGTFNNPNFGDLTQPDSTFKSETDVPFVGIYTAYTQGGFFIDGQVRADYFQSSLTDANSGLSNDSLKARGLAVAANTGYQMAVGTNVVIVPSAGITWSRVKIDDLNVIGLRQLDGPQLPYARGVVSVEDIDSVLGRLSIRVATQFQSGQVFFQPFAIASVFREFAGDVNATSLQQGTGNASIDGLKLNMSTDRIGTYAQFGVGTGFAVANTGWRGYARADYRKGENVEGWGVNGGLRYMFNSTP